MGDETMRVTFPGTRRGGLLLRGLLTVVFVAAAGMKFAAVPFEVAGFARFGYPLWFMYAVGAAQLVGAALLWTLEQGLGADFTPEVKTAWTETYVALSGVMTSAG